MYSGFSTPCEHCGLAAADLLYRTTPGNNPAKCIHAVMRPRLAFVFREYLCEKFIPTGRSNTHPCQSDRKASTGFQRTQQPRRVGAAFPDKLESIVECHDNRSVDPIAGGSSQVPDVIADRSNVACTHKSAWQDAIRCVVPKCSSRCALLDRPALRAVVMMGHRHEYA